MTEKEFYNSIIVNQNIKTFWLYNQLKIHDLHNHGLIKNSSLDKIAKSINVNRATLRRHINKMKSLGWVRMFDWGIVLVSFRKIINNDPEKLTNNKFRNKYKNETDYEKLRLEMLSERLKENLGKQHAAQILNNTVDEKLAKKAIGLEKKRKDYLHHSSISLSCRAVAKMCGYKSAMSGHKIERDLKRGKYFRIKKRTKKLCKISEYSFYLKADPSLQRKCFISQDGKHVLQRLTNNLIPIKKRL